MSNQKKIGNRFQEDFSKSVTDYYIERYRDAPTMYKNVDNPADFFIFSGKFIVLIECKSTKEVSNFPIKNIGMKQVWEMLRRTCHKHVFGGFAINFRTIDETYFFFVADFVKWYLTRCRSSLSIQWIRAHGYKIAQKKKITRWTYGTNGLISWIDQSTYVREDVE